MDKINGVSVRRSDPSQRVAHPKEMPEFFVIELFDAERPIIIPSAMVAEANKRMQENGIDHLENLVE